MDLYQKKIQKECTDLWRKGGSSSSASELSELSWLSSSSFFGFSRKEQANFPTKSRKRYEIFSGFQKKMGHFTKGWGPDPDRIRIQLGQRIRIQTGQNCVPQK
jgi:hypothetical protein